VCAVEKIVDGDSLVCGGKRIRLLLVDAPELGQGEPGLQSKRALEELLPLGSKVSLELDVDERDKYGRLLAYVYTSQGTLVNEEMARRGYVLQYTRPPNVGKAERISAAVAEARQHKRGLWREGFTPCTPRDFRHGRCR
jgi:micrococcal nuclease